VVFPGGVGTAEEILYILGILLQADNAEHPFPVIFSGPAGSETYFNTVDRFIRTTLGERAASCYEIVVDDAYEVAERMREGLERVTEHRKATGEAYHFDWQLRIPLALQQTFEPTHANMRALNLSRRQQDYELAAQLRCALSGIVAGNVKEPGIRAIEEHGPFELHGEPEVIEALDELLEAFVAQRRMKINHEDYVPCFRLARNNRAEAG
jgi:hypothetical protein